MIFSLSLESCSICSTFFCFEFERHIEVLLGSSVGILIEFVSELIGSAVVARLFLCLVEARFLLELFFKKPVWLNLVLTD